MTRNFQCHNSGQIPQNKKQNPLKNNAVPGLHLGGPFLFPTGFQLCMKSYICFLQSGKEKLRSTVWSFGSRDFKALLGKITGLVTGGMSQ